MGRETDWICIYLMLEKKVVYISVIPLVRISINSSHSFLHTLHIPRNEDHFSSVLDTLPLSQEGPGGHQRGRALH